MPLSGLVVSDDLFGEVHDWLGVVNRHFTFEWEDIPERKEYKNQIKRTLCR